MSSIMASTSLAYGMDCSSAFSTEDTVHFAPPGAQRYGEGFAAGFQHFRLNGDFADVTVVTPNGTEWRLHSIFLSNRSEFFHKALTSDFQESRTRRIELGDYLGMEKALESWPTLVDYFYSDTVYITEHNVIGLLALARQLLVRSIDNYCMDFIRAQLCIDNCISYLHEAVKYNIHDLQADCMMLAARGFHFLYAADTSGLPPSTIMDLLRHRELVVDCELQVVQFVQRYLSSTQVDKDAAGDICHEIRFMYLDNSTLTSLMGCAAVPRELVLEGCAERLQYMDRECQDWSALPCPPRLTYICNWRYGLPGGAPCLDIDVDSIWEQLSKCCTVKVSGVSEGVAENVLSSDAEAWFETDDCVDPLPWIEVHMPPNVTIVQFSRYSFAHGHRRSGYYRLRNWKTQIAEDPASTRTDVVTRYSPSSADPRRVYTSEPFDMLVSASVAADLKPWRVLRLQATGCQEDGVHRLCVRNLRIYGVARIDLLQQSSGFVPDLPRSPLSAMAPLRTQLPGFAPKGYVDGHACATPPPAARALA